MYKNDNAARPVWMLRLMNMTCVPKLACRVLRRLIDADAFSLNRP